MRHAFLSLCLFLLVPSARAIEGPVPKSRFGRLDHVFLIVMENKTDTFVLGNADAPFINAYAKRANRAAEYFAVGHPSAPNYLELVGGSNFGLTEDYWPDWAGAGCVDRAPGSKGCEHALKPIGPAGVDNAVVATASKPEDCNGEVYERKAVPTPRNCARRDYPAAPYTGKSIADQLVSKGLTWKTYQQSLPTAERGLSGVNYADGVYSNLSSTDVFAVGTVQKLYAVKHDPFAYFENVQRGADPALSLARVADFDGPAGLWADLQSEMPSFSLIVPDQCRDMHGAEGGPARCGWKGPAGRQLIRAGDAQVQELVEGIKASPAWKKGRNALVLTWDENDFTDAPNRVVTLIETSYAPNGRVSRREYDHFSLLRTLEAGFGLPCLNHACDADAAVMDDVFGAP